MSAVDVIVPCYRYGHFLRDCVESVLSQEAIPVRVLVIDDASPDDTAEVADALANEDSRVTFLRHAKNQGHIDTYNEGIEWASADYLLLLSADDYLLPGALERSIGLMDAHPEVGFTFGKVLTSATAPPPRREASPRILGGLAFITLIERARATNIVPTPTAVVRTSLQKRVGGYRRELPHAGDLEMWLRLAAHASVGMLDSFQAVYRQHGANMQRSYYEAGWTLPDLEQRKAAIDCFIQTCEHALPNASEVHSQLRRALARDGLRMARVAYGAGDLESSLRLSEFAVRISPGVRLSVDSARLIVGRAVGVRAWLRMNAWRRNLFKRR